MRRELIAACTAVALLSGESCSSPIPSGVEITNISGSQLEVSDNPTLAEVATRVDLLEPGQTAVATCVELVDGEASSVYVRKGLKPGLFKYGYVFVVEPSTKNQDNLHIPTVNPDGAHLAALLPQCQR